MKEKKRLPEIAARIIKSHRADSVGRGAVYLTEDNFSGWLEPPADLRGLKKMVSHSSILPQCIAAYKSNIAGFGIGIRYKEDYPAETEEMKAEFLRAEEIIEGLNADTDTKEVFENLVEARETYGIAYAEVIRNNAGEVSGIEFIRDTATMRKSVPMGPYVEVRHCVKGEDEPRFVMFCKYRQQIGAEMVYFKEIGDPRVMDRRTGEYESGSETIPVEYQANEVLEFAIGAEPYGEVRWVGQIPGVDGSRKAENLNNRYFEEGRHTPLLIMIKGGTLTRDSFVKLQQYMDGIKGEAGQHAFMILETESSGNRAEFMQENPPEIEVKELASILQKDELFQDYLENNRRKVQSAFRLPDLYVGYTTDFNRATAQAAQEITEKQVFQPQRRSLAWVVNNKLLADYGLKYVEAYFMAPDISNPEDMAKILNITERAGGLTPNMAKEISCAVMGKVSEDYEGDWGGLPLQYSKAGDKKLRIEN